MTSNPLVISSASSSKKKQSFFRRLLEKPQHVWIRKAFYQIHLWAGILVALYIIAIGVSGSILVFKEELMSKPHLSASTIDYKACTPEQLMHAMDLASTAVPQLKAFLASCPSPANGFFTVTVREQPQHVPGMGRTKGPKRGVDQPQEQRQKPAQRTVYIDPQTWAVAGTSDRESSWLDWLARFHINLLLGRSGRLWNGIGASTLLLLTLTGVVLWWPGIRNWTRALKVDPRKNWRRMNYELHSAIGIWTVFFTLTWALTGMYFTWPKLFTVPIQKISQVTTANYPADQIRGAMAHASASTQTLDVRSMMDEAQRQSPHGHLEGIFFGNGARPIFTVYMARGVMGDYSNADFVYFDQRNNQHLYTWHRGENHTLGDWLIWLIAPLHFGSTWGQGVKAVWCMLGLALPTLTVTGLLMYWNRWLGRRWSKLTSS